MIQNPGRFLTKCIVTLCVALTVVFAQASAAAVMNGIQHDIVGAGDHVHIAFSAVVLGADHHEGQGAHPPGVADEDDAERDVGPGHHHHLDSPSASLAFASEVTSAIADGDERLLFGQDDMVRTLGSPGPERPPKLSASRV